MHLIRNNKGFTFAELVITVALWAMLLVPFFGLLHTALRYYGRAEQDLELQQNLRIALEAITWDLRKSQGLVAMAAGISLDEQNLLLLGREQELIWYYLSGQDLRRAVKGRNDGQFQGHNPVAGGIVFLGFSYNRVPLAQSKQVTVTVAGRSDSGRWYELSATVSLRVD